MHFHRQFPGGVEVLDASLDPREGDHRFVPGGFGEEQGELVAADASDGVGFPDVGGEALSGGPEH